MKTIIFHLVQTAIFSVLTIITSCGANENKIRYATSDQVNTTKEIIGHSNDTAKRDTSNIFNLSDDDLDNNVYYQDTVTANTTSELVKQIKSNRLIMLVNNDYRLNGTLQIKDVKNLTIIGAKNSYILVGEKNETVLHLSNTHNIHLDGLIIGNTAQRPVIIKQSALEISHSYNINITNCKLVGVGLLGLMTTDVTNLKFTNSEITACTMLMFDLGRSRNVEFKNTKFHSNNLGVSVLGGFTNLTKDVVFVDCDFIDNIPDSAGNPAFNFFENDSNIDEKILFSQCTFKNNKGFKWYGEKIKLDHCDVDSSGILGMTDNH